MFSFRYIALLLIFFISLNAASQELSSAQELDLNYIYSNTMSPYCPGLTLSGCRSDDARALRELIRDKIINGETKEQISEYLADKYKDKIDYIPGGSSNLIWIAPVIFFLLGAFFVVSVKNRARDK